MKIGRPLIALAALSLATVVAVGACVASPASERPSASVAPSPTASPSAEMPSPSAHEPAARPDWATDLVAVLDCDGPVSPLGAGSSLTDANFAAVAPTLEASVEAFIAGEAPIYATLPLDGYRELEVVPGWGLYGHVVDGRTKVAVSFTDTLVGDAWANYQVAACDPAEFDPDVPLGYDVRIWVGPDGRVPTTTLFEREDCPTADPYGMRVLQLEGRLYLRDPDPPDFDPAGLDTTYDGDADLPADTVDLGLRDGDRRLWAAADGSAVFVVTPAVTERWPHVVGDEIVRTDCN
jgi:hypothetical protein